MTINKTLTHKKTLPFLRWAGGKKWLKKDINDLLPRNGFNSYHEVFLGGGAIFFHLEPKQMIFLNDLNQELIDTYRTVKTNVESVINELKKFENTEEFYYYIRAKKYRLDSRRAAQFIFLNQTSFNGIYRVNLQGQYNVPYGFRTKNFLEPENLRKVSESLQKAQFSNGDFSRTIDNVCKGDLVFLDPPYTITHNNNGFLKYNQKLFSENDQYRLSKMIDQIKEKEAFYILTNAAHFKVKEIFDKGDRVLKMKRASLVGGTNAKRGKYSEYVFTNCF
ncbi:MAG: Dam family site-specific DNA-(adenine-N6)-methyltransferase [Crocinitomix sp.]|nr:Dam family site-specific DNA-(adenine-N6)-methyltransferase [Crocinitomix sp.]